MSWYPYNVNMGQELQGDGAGIRQDRGFIAHLHAAIGDAPVADIDGVKTAFTLLAAAQPGITAGILTFAIPRVLSITGTMAGGSLTGNVVINGLDAAGAVLAETIALNDNATVAGLKAFASVTSIDYPARVTAADTVKIGFTDLLGLCHKLAHNTVLAAYLGEVKEGTAPTVVVSAATMCLNTVDLNSALDGTKAVDVYLIV